MPSKTTTALFAATFFLICSASPTLGQDVLLFDDFDPRNTDGSPEQWVRVGGGDVAQQDFSLVVTGISSATYAGADGRDFDDVSLLSQTRLLDGDADSSLAILTRLTTDDSIYGSISGGGILSLGSFNAGDLATTETTMNPTSQDIFMRLDAVGPQFKLWAWPIEGNMPDAPQLVATQDGLTSGSVGGLFLDSENERGSAAFRFFEVRSIPEPSSLPLALTALVGGLVLVRRSRRA